MVNEKALYSHPINCVGVDPLHISDNGVVSLELLSMQGKIVIIRIMRAGSYN